MKHEAPAAHVPDLLLERLRLRELPAAEEAALRSRIEREPELRQRMAALEASDAALAASGDLQALATRVSAAARTPAPQHRRADRLVGWAAAAAAVAATAMMVPGALARRPAGGTAEPAASVSETRVKGLQPALTVFRKTKSGSEPLPDGSAAREGDLLRLAYDAAGRA
ncbi:MAG TPA: ActD-like protein, partial [Vicinamibacteria bacterium]|nr:ActD-like protein [Vicinamibacteria bacterium]